MPARRRPTCSTTRTEQALVNNGTLPQDQIPLVIQDKTFVPNDAQLNAEDPTWNKAKWGGQGNLWYPHVYMPNQNPSEDSGANSMGRWDYGPWFWPPYTGLAHGPCPTRCAPARVTRPAARQVRTSPTRACPTSPR